MEAKCSTAERKVTSVEAKCAAAEREVAGLTLALRAVGTDG